MTVCFLAPLSSKLFLSHIFDDDLCLLHLEFSSPGGERGPSEWQQSLNKSTEFLNQDPAPAKTELGVNVHQTPKVFQEHQEWLLSDNWGHGPPTCSSAEVGTVWLHFISFSQRKEGLNVP